MAQPACLFLCGATAPERGVFDTLALRQGPAHARGHCPRLQNPSSGVTAPAYSRLSVPSPQNQRPISVKSAVHPLDDSAHSRSVKPGGRSEREPGFRQQNLN